MTPADLYSVTFALMAEEAGGIGPLEKQLKEWEEEQEKIVYMNSAARFAPDRKVPQAVAEDMKAIMQFAPPAPRKKAD